MEETKLTPTQSEILNLITKEFLTPKQIKIRRNTTQEAVNKVIRKLKKKGLLKISCQEVVKIGVAQQPSHNQLRIHAQQFSIRILWQDSKYKALLKKCSQLDIDGNTICLWPHSIDIYSNNSFYGDTLPHAFGKSAEYKELLL